MGLIAETPKVGLVQSSKFWIVHVSETRQIYKSTLEVKGKRYSLHAAKDVVEFWTKTWAVGAQKQHS